MRFLRGTHTTLLIFYSAMAEQNLAVCYNGVDCWDGDLIQDPISHEWYCSRHITVCAEEGCEKVSFAGIDGKGFRNGSLCENCYPDLAEYFCNEHAHLCQICECIAELCSDCTLYYTKDTYNYLCQDCCYKWNEVVIIKPAKVRGDSKGKDEIW